MSRPGRGDGVVALFDIDGTLIRAGDPDHRAAFDHALQHVYRVPATLDGVDLAGRLDRQIARLALAPHGVDAPAADRRLAELMAAMGTHYASAVGVGDRADHVLPGVLHAVAALLAEKVTLAVVTGTARPVARAKLAAAGLDGAFPVGAYGDEADDRAVLVERGLAAAASWAGRPFAAARAIVVGDTPRDIDAARGAGCRVLAVASGAVARDRLADARPDALLPDLRDTAAVVAAVLGD